MTTPQFDEPGMTITCQQVVEVITDYLEDVMDPDLRRKLESHLDLCPGCAEYLAQMRQTIRTLGHVPVASLSPRAQAELLAAFRDRFPHQPWWTAPSSHRSGIRPLRARRGAPPT